MRRILGWLFLTLATLFGFAQTYFLFTLRPSPMLTGFAESYAVSSSIRTYGLAFVAAAVGFLLLQYRSRAWCWVALGVAIVCFWTFVGREVWIHYVELPRMRHEFLATHPYFRITSLWAFLPRLAWHILLPVAVIIAGVLCLSVRSSELPAGAAGSRSP